MRKKLTSNLGLKILALFAAALLWLIVVNIDDPNTTVQFSGVEVKIVNEDFILKNGKTMKALGEKTVSVTVRGKRSRVSKIESSDIVVTADMKDIVMQSLVPLEVSIKGFEGAYDSATTNPRNMEFSIEDEQTQTYPITPSARGTVQDGKVLGEMTVDPETIKIGGPSSVISTISKVVAEVNVSGLAKDTEKTAELRVYDKNDNVIEATNYTVANLGSDGVKVQIKLLEEKEVDVNFDDSKIGIAAGYNYNGLTYEPTKLKIQGRASVLAGISEIKVPAEALESQNLSEITEKTVDITPYLPEHVQLSDENQSNVVVTINVEQPGTRTLEVPTSAVVIKNLADDLTADLGEETYVTLKLKGENAALESFAAANKANKLSVDLKNYTSAGTHKVPVNVELPGTISLAENAEVTVILEEK